MRRDLLDPARSYTQVCFSYSFRYHIYSAESIDLVRLFEHLVLAVQNSSGFSEFAQSVPGTGKMF